MSKDYYKTLGVEKNANQDDIKKAFRKLAHEYHPDKKGGDEAKFKEINEAYQVLSDEKKRAQYDQFGSAFEHGQAGGGFSGFDGFTNGFSSQGFNINMDDLGDMFGGLGDIFGFGGTRGGKRGPKKGRDIETLLTIDFSEAVFGAEKEISLKKIITCDKCHGNGAEPGAKIETCKTCGGTGRVIKMQRTIFGNMQVQATCNDCGGEGKIYSQKCSKCSGRGVAEEIVKLKLKIPAGIDNGESIRLTGQGEAGEKGGVAGNLYVKIRIKEDKRFMRNEYNIESEAEISFTQAALGDNIEVETVDGLVALKIPEGTQSGTIFKLKGKGVPILQSKGFWGDGSKRGDHLVEILVKTPKNLTKKQKELLRELDL
ncbi:MAG: molecular chaperone DnaJ [Patescibacteria group bacterium]|nr:molecular chaperone DnaJ [Patescibacteria group bacterium]MDD4610777.1 molecular chaperone DnaJ [Patescibacteria group bacterium]